MCQRHYIPTLLMLWTFIYPLCVGAQTVKQAHDIPVSAYAIDMKEVNLSSAILNHDSEEAVLVIGKNNTSVLSILINRPNDATDEYMISLSVENKNGQHEIREMLYGDFSYTTMEGRLRVQQLVEAAVNREDARMHFSQLTPVHIQVCPIDRDWVAKCNDSLLNRCFTWYFHVNDQQHVFDYNWSVSSGPYEKTQLLAVFDRLMDVAFPGKVEEACCGAIKVLSGPNAFFIQGYDYPTNLLPYGWLEDFASQDSTRIKALQEKIYRSQGPGDKHPFLTGHSVKLILSPPALAGIWALPENSFASKESIEVWIWDADEKRFFYIHVDPCDVDAEIRGMKMLQTLRKKDR